jgi:Skp family chaperone for outer membrane proteins
VAAACVAAFAVIFLTPPKHDENMTIAYVDRKMITNQAQAMQMGQEALQEIFSNGNEEEQLTDLFNAK